MSYLLIDHPALPIPFHNSSGLVFEQSVGLNEAKFAHKDRLVCAIQVLALNALMAEFEMWLPRRAVHTAQVVDRGNGKQVIVGGYPVALSKVYNRLGGGETATRLMRDATVQTVCERFRVSLPDEIDSGAQGWFLDPFLANVLDRLALPVDRTTARNLWAVLWPQPRLPEDGEITHISLPDRATSMRLGASMVARLRQKKRLAWLREVAEDGTATAPYPAYGSRGTLILTGIFSEQEILAVERWVQLKGCSACLVGVFPQTWPASNLLDDTSRDLVQLAMVGAPRALCRIEIEKRTQSGFAQSTAEREALTTAARTLFVHQEETVADDTSESGKRVFHLLSLLPEGLPEGFLSCFADTKGPSLDAILASLPVVFSNNAWRLVSQRLMVRDPLHLDVSGLFLDEDPRSLLHRALGGDSPDDLIRWMRSRIDDLESDAVRSLFAVVGPGELGREVRLLHIEACLAELDPAGARLAAQGLQRDKAAAHNAWINAIDPPAGWNLPESLWDEVERLPGAAAEVTLFSLRTIKDLSKDEISLLEKRLGLAISKMRGFRRRWYEIEAASVLNSAQLEDRPWRRQLAGYEPKLRRHILHKLAIRYTKTNRYSRAERILKRLEAETTSPGRLALIYQDLSSTVVETEREGLDIWFLLKALRLFEAAGFQHRSQNVLFNLAASDLDHLEIERAQRRLEQASGGAPDIFNRLEMARLALARGDERGLSAILAELGSWANAEHTAIREALQLLIGVEHVLRGNLVAATGNLVDGGKQGEAWLEIVNALQGKRPGVRDDRNDEWGLHSAARIIYAARQGSLASVNFSVENRIEDALALALVARLLDRVPPTSQVRWATRLLERRGMNGWAAWLTAGDHVGLGFAGGLVSLIEGGLMPDLPLDAASEIFSGIGITGLEVKSSDGQVLWVCGEGERGPERRHGRLLFVPLGGDPSGNIEWRLLTGVLDLTTPLLPRSDEVDVSKTGILGISEGVRELRAELLAYAPSAATVLLLGETGVGKEVAAHAVHRLSGRRGGFAAINIAGMPESLVEAELFGAVKGAFTGADRNRKGIVESVEGGTLFLDEIGDLGLPMQVKLLRFLESYEVRPVGSDHTHIVDVRIVAATHRDLEASIRLGSFREDLFYRISTAPVKIPPLRDRRQDILLLRDHFEREFCAKHGFQLQRWSREAESALRHFDWPGNIRQLRSVVESAILRYRDLTIRPEMLNIEGVRTASRRGSWEEVQADFRREYLSEALKRNGGNRSATARELGISRQALLYQIKTLRLK